MPLNLNPMVMKEIGQDLFEKEILLDYFSVNWDNLMLSSNTSCEKSYKISLKSSSLYSTRMHL